MARRFRVLEGGDRGKHQSSVVRRNQAQGYTDYHKGVSMVAALRLAARKGGKRRFDFEEVRS